jgi:hypothetical protein
MPITNIPYAGTLDGAHSNPPWNMDVIHIQQLYRICHRIRPRVVVEVGSYMGASTSAFVEAMKDGLVEQLYCYDIRPTAELKKVVAQAPNDNAAIYSMPYPESPRYADLIFIDGDHEHGAGWDTLAAVVMGCPHLVFHDHNCLNVGLGCRGVDRAVRLLQQAPNMRWTHDCRKRAGMWTHRGLFYAHHVLYDSGWVQGEDLP